MDVLFIVPYVPNLVRTRPYNFIRALSERGNRVTVLTVCANEADEADLAVLRKMVYAVEAVSLPVWRSLLNCLPAFLSGVPLQTRFSWDAGLFSRLNGRFPFDVVHVEHLRGVQYALHLKKQTQLPVIWDSVDCITHLFRQAATQSKNTMLRWRSRFELGRTERYERWLLDKFDQILVTSHLDREAMQSLNPQQPAPITVVPNGVDLNYFRPDTAVTRQENALVVSGKMSYHANISMVLYLVEKIMPYVWREQPGVTLTIVGKDPAKEVMALTEHPNITVTGTVPEIRPYLQQATVALTPLTYGAGVQNKVLEAMACGTPVVSTTRAIKPLSVQPGRDLLAADDPAQFAHHVLELLANPAQRAQIGRAARAYVEHNHNWHTLAGDLERIYQQAKHQHIPALKQKATATG
ncbi:MAG: glycosyltransferase [Candidatus Promineifilaceae bacterium]